MARAPQFIRNGPNQDSSVSKRFLPPLIISRWLVLATLCCFLSADICRAADKEEFPGESTKWFRYRSPHFELLSAAREAESRELLHHLELLRALFFDTFKLKERQPLPITIYFFANAKDFKAYAPASQHQELGGYYLDQPDRAVIAISPAWDHEWARHVIFHEYIHHLNRTVGATPPLWYNEGLAELFSTIEFQRDRVVLGKHLPWYVTTLRNNGLLPLETLFAIESDSPVYNNGKHSGQFYAESWLLLHYLRYGNNQLDQIKVEQLMDYFLNEAPEADPVIRRQVFKETIGLDYSDMRQRLKDYLQEGTFHSHKEKLPQIPGPKTYERRAVSLPAISLSLAELSLRINHSANARLRLLEEAGKDPVNTRCWEALGSDAWSGGDTGVAQERWQRALAAGSTNPAIYHELGRMEAQRWFENFDYNFRLPEQRAEQLRLLLKRSIECAPEQSDGYELLAWVEASVLNPDIANVELVQQRFKTLKGKARTLVALALVRVHLNDRAGAVTQLDQLDQMNPDYWAASAAETIRAKLEDRLPRKLERPAPSQAQRPRLRFDLLELPR